MPRLVVGLGNPGKKYDRTRHNIGFLVVDRCCARRGVEAEKRAHEARYAFVQRAAAGGDQVAFVKPQTYMNDSGMSVVGFAGFYKVEPQDILVVCDDIALPCGQLRVRASGSSGGQKGLESIIRQLGRQDFPRLRVGIGSPPAYMDAADYVLGQFGEEERPAIEAAVDRAADAVQVWLEDGIERAMSRFNAKLETEKKKKDDRGDRAPGATPGSGGRPPTEGD
jgi:PTH1 family peptidyl-tRNA hydrolase